MRYFLFALLSGLLLAGAWPNYGFAPLLLVAFIPLFHLINSDIKRFKKLLLAALVFFIWNAICTWWIYNAHWVGMVAAVSLNTIMMTLVVFVYLRFKKYLSNSNGWLLFVSCWLSMEYLMYRWDLLWPWMTLGNGFANFPKLIQWYEYTGVLGGSLWVLLVNVWLYNLWGKIRHFGFGYLKQLPVVVSLIILIIAPICCSYGLYTEKFDGDKVEVLVVQPNVDPYKEKFNNSPIRQMQSFFELAATNMDSSVQLVVGPETVYPSGIWEQDLSFSAIPGLSSFLTKFSKTDVLLGLTTYRLYDSPKTSSARALSNGKYYDVYNASALFGVPFGYQISQKGKLVPGAEMMPFSNFLSPLKKLMLDFGGTSGSMGMPDSIRIFNGPNGLNVASAICYESVCGEYVGQMVEKGANLIAVITNDGWWGNTQGHKQHMAYARLRAIEHRRVVARSANTGISGFIMPNGEILKELSWAKTGVLRANIPLVNDCTFYTLHGDYLGRLASFLLILLSLFALVKSRSV